MNKHRLEGSRHEMKGAAKESLGNASLRREGRAEQYAGKLQRAMGVASDALRAAIKRR